MNEHKWEEKLFELKSCFDLNADPYGQWIEQWIEDEYIKSFGSKEEREESCGIQSVEISI